MDLDAHLFDKMLHLEMNVDLSEVQFLSDSFLSTTFEGMPKLFCRTTFF